jgi:hypothetical protein
MATTISKKICRWKCDSTGSSDQRETELGIKNYELGIESSL